MPRSSGRRAYSGRSDVIEPSSVSKPIADAWERNWARLAPGQGDAAEAARIEEIRTASSRSLREFFHRFWGVLEPSTPLVTGWALDAILEHLELFARGEIKRLLINVPPGFSKSMATSVFMPAWVWGPLGQPGKRFISTSYDATLATRDNGRSRQLMQSEEYQACWPLAWTSDEKAKTRYANTSGGWRQTSSVNSALTGHRGDFIIVDDPHSTKTADSEVMLDSTLRWFTEGLSTRLNNITESGIVVIMQRLHTRDISGHILANELGYEHLCIPMEFEPDHPFPSTRWTDPRTQAGELADPVRFPEGALGELKKVLRSDGGTYAEAGQLQQRPTPRGGGMFRETDFEIIDECPPLSAFAAGPIRGWDLASTKDERAAFTAGVLMGILKTGEVVIIDSRRRQLEPRGVYDFLLSVAKLDGPGVLQSIPQDPGQAGKDQRRHIAKHLMGFPTHFSTESGSKETRAAPLASQGEAGNLLIVRGPWNTAFVNEATTFPRGDWKDQVDAASRAFSRLMVKRDTGNVAAPKAFRR